MAHPGGRPLKYTLEKIKTLGEQFFKDCDEQGRPYTITGLALALGTDRTTIINYENRNEFFDTIREFKNKCECYAEEIALNKGHSGSIFALKNYGWRDSHDLNHGGQSDKPIVIKWQE